MRKLVVTAALVALGAACTPDIPQDPAPTGVVVARFDPSANPRVLPSPNDLIPVVNGKLALAPPTNASPADLEFVSFLNSLAGFPASTSGSVTFNGELDVSTVNADTIRVLDVTDAANPVAVTGYKVGYAVTPNTGTDQVSKVSVIPPSGGWTLGHRYAVAVVGGENGVRSSEGGDVVGAATWFLIRSESSLVKCDGDELSVDNCQTATEVIPSAQLDPQKKFAEQTLAAVSLEPLRRKYAPYLGAMSSVHGVSRDDVALLWSFQTTEPALVFDPGAFPAQVPTPNDLAIDQTTGLVNAPIDPNSSPAQQEFTRDYLNTLNGFPAGSTGQAFSAGADLDPTTVNAGTVVVLDLTTVPPSPVPSATISYSTTTHSITVTPPANTWTNFWTKGKRYAVVVIGGSAGVKTTTGAAPVPSLTWIFARSNNTLVSCPNDDLADPGCVSSVTATTIEPESAVRLEKVRLGYKPLLDGLAALNPAWSRDNISVLWTFSISNRPEIPFRLVDKATSQANCGAISSIIPFPNDLAIDPVTGLVSLPVPNCGASPPLPQLARIALISGLNTLDGFSLSAPIVPENSDTLPTLDQGLIDAATVPTSTGFLKLTPGGNAPSVTACLNCASSEVALPIVPPLTSPFAIDDPQQLQFVPQVPLDERSKYGAFITTDLKDTAGKALMPATAFALIRLSEPLVDSAGKSTVSVVSDLQATTLEPIRAAHKAYFDGLAAAGTPRAKIAHAWAFTTQSTVSVLQALAGVPTLLGAAGLSADPLYASDQTASVKTEMGALPKGNIGKIFLGALEVPHLITATGTLNPSPGPTSIRTAPFILALPTTAAPATGYPITIFSHGLSGNRKHMLSLADALAASGRAVIAIDSIFHGERSTCLGYGATIGGSDNAACTNASDTCVTGSDGTGRCQAASRASNPCDATTIATLAPGTPPDVFCEGQGAGRCVADGFCEGTTFAPAFLAKAWNYISLSNFFATRDSFRHSVADLAQVVRMLKDSTTLETALGASIDATKIDYVGMSLGGFQGALFGSASSDVHRMVLNVPGGDLVDVLLTSPGFTAQRTGVFANVSALGNPPGSPGFDTFFAIIRWIADSAAPNSAIYSAVNPVAPADRAVLVQYITEDQTIPNGTTEKLIASANQNAQTKQAAVRKWEPSTTALPIASRHGFLLNFTDPATTAAAQLEATTFLNTGVQP